LVVTGMPLKSEIRPVRSHRVVKVGENPYLTPNTSLSLKATLPRRGRVGAENKPEQVRTKSAPSQDQARTKSEPTRYAPAPLYHPCNPSPGPLDHPLRGSRLIWNFGSGIEKTKKGDPKIALDEAKPQFDDCMRIIGRCKTTGERKAVNGLRGRLCVPVPRPEGLGYG